MQKKKKNKFKQVTSFSGKLKFLCILDFTGVPDNVTGNMLALINKNITMWLKLSIGLLNLDGLPNI